MRTERLPCPICGSEMWLDNQQNIFGIVFSLSCRATTGHEAHLDEYNDGHVEVKVATRYVNGWPQWEQLKFEDSWMLCGVKEAI